MNLDIKMFNSIKNLLNSKSKKRLCIEKIGDSERSHESHFYGLGKAVWMNRNYEKFADEAYIKNVIAHRAINLIAHAAASIPITLYQKINNKYHAVLDHQILRLLKHPNPLQSGVELMESIYIYRQISGNAFLLMLTSSKRPMELYSLRPDRVEINAVDTLLPSSYRYKTGNKFKEYKVDSITGMSQILHIKNFHPLSDWSGLSSIEAAAYSIDQHNQAGAWNQALLQNGARPSGAITIKDRDGKPGVLNAEQFRRIKDMIDQNYSGAHNAGKPMILEGGLEWQEMSFSPKDMDFIESKHSSARDIALAFGVPPQLLGIPGDNTYSNLVEARSALWEQTILPIAENTIEHVSRWLLPYFSSQHLELRLDVDNIPAISGKREFIWNRIKNADFMTINEKRAAVGLSPIKEGDILEHVKV